jgi:hypothetical protein
MARDRRTAPRLESLEGKQLLTTMAQVHFDHIVQTAPVLNGTFQGALSTFLDTPGPPETRSEIFYGRSRAMGAVRIVVSDQMDATGHLLGGQVVLSNPRGSIHLGFGANDLVSTQSVGSLSTQVLKYTVAAGTGAYAWASGSGTFTVLQKAGKSATLVIDSSGT